MRLLHIESDRLFLTDFRTEEIPPYAILSHRWGESEILFEDVTSEKSGDEEYKEKAGYRKIEFCAKQAARDQLKYFWIDTCCINKWNLEELSKAINSMFLWYRNSAKCYVYLPDVSAAQDDWKPSFKKSDWFTRGWTLQELIAPKTLEFFSSEGDKLGDKRSLQQLVRKITGIPVDALQEGRLDGFSVSERVEWAEFRETTEEEDKVYCLLGILDIVMPVAYGEGAEKAWRRLQDEIEAASRAPSMIPFSQNENFVGRDLQLTELEGMLFKDTQTARIAIVGSPGIGKSQLALELVHRIRHNIKSCSIFWVNASDINSLQRSYTSIAQKLNLPGWDDQRTDIKQLIKNHLSKAAVTQWVLILDNLGTAVADLDNYLPQADNCAIVVTTNNADCMNTLVSHSIELKELTTTSAQQLLESHLKTTSSRAEEQEAGILVHELSYLPLAIVQAAAYINARNITLQDYRHKLIEYWDGGSHHRAKGPVAATLSISMDHICSVNELAIDFLSIAACVNHKDIPYDLLQAHSPDKDKNDALKILSSYALITRRPAESAIDVHQLVHCIIQEELEEFDKFEYWTRITADLLIRVFSNQVHINRSRWRRLLPHITCDLSHEPSDKWNKDQLYLMEIYTRVLVAEGRYKDAEDFQSRLLEHYKTEDGMNHHNTLIAADYLGSIIEAQGRWSEAEALQSRAVGGLRVILGADDPDTIYSMSHLALTYWRQGRYSDAESLQVQVMDHNKTRFGAEHLRTLNSMNDLADTYHLSGRLAEAETLKVQVLKTCQKEFGAEDTRTVNSMGNLVGLYIYQGRFREAEALEIQVVEYRRVNLGAEHPHTLTGISDLGLIYESLGRLAEAEALQVELVEAHKRTLGAKHPETLNSMGNLAHTWRKRGFKRKATALLEETYKLHAMVLGPQHTKTKGHLKSLGEWEAEKESNTDDG